MKFCTLTWTASQADAGSPPAGPNPTEQCWTHWFSVFCAFRVFFAKQLKERNLFFLPLLVCSSHGIKHGCFPTSLSCTFYFLYFHREWRLYSHEHRMNDNFSPSRLMLFRSAHIESCLTVSPDFEMRKNWESQSLKWTSCSFVEFWQNHSRAVCRVPCTCTSCSSDWTYQSFEAWFPGTKWQLWSIKTHFVPCFLASARFKTCFKTVSFFHAKQVYLPEISLTKQKKVGVFFHLEYSCVSASAALRALARVGYSCLCVCVSSCVSSCLLSYHFLLLFMCPFMYFVSPRVVAVSVGTRKTFAVLLMLSLLFTVCGLFRMHPGLELFATVKLMLPAWWPAS